MIKCKSPKQRFKFLYFFTYITCMGGTVVEKKKVMAKIAGSSPDIFCYFTGEGFILICIKCILNDTNLNNSFKIHHFKKRK